MNPRRVATEMWPTLTFAGGLIVFFAYASFAHVEKSATVRVVDRLAPSLAANVSAVTAPQPAATIDPVVNTAEVATAAELLAEVAVAPTAPAPEKQQAIVVAALTDPAEILPSDTPSVSAAAAATID